MDSLTGGEILREASGSISSQKHLIASSNMSVLTGVCWSYTVAYDDDDNISGLLYYDKEDQLIVAVDISVSASGKVTRVRRRRPD